MVCLLFRRVRFIQLKTFQIGYTGYTGSTQMKSDVPYYCKMNLYKKKPNRNVQYTAKVDKTVSGFTNPTE